MSHTSYEPPTADEIDRMQVPELERLLRTIRKHMLEGSRKHVLIDTIKETMDAMSASCSACPPLPSLDAIGAMDVPALKRTLREMEARDPTDECLFVIEEIRAAIADQSWITVQQNRSTKAAGPAPEPPRRRSLSPPGSASAPSRRRSLSPPGSELPPSRRRALSPPDVLPKPVSTTQDEPVEISDDDNDDVGESRSALPKDPPLPRLPPRDPNAPAVPSHAPYGPGEYMSRRWIGLYSRVMENGDVKRFPGFTKVCVSYICSIDFKEPVPGASWKELESNAVLSLRNSTGWLTDDVINGCMGLMNNRQELPEWGDDEPTPRCIFAHSHLVPKLFLDPNTCNLRYSNNMNFAEADLLIVPVNCSGSHWILMVAYLRDKRIVVYNSYQSRFTVYQKNLEVYLNAVGKNRGLEFLQGEWEKTSVIPPNIPSQPDGWNCGLFTIAAADCIARGRHPSGYTAEDMPRMRRELLRILGFDP